MKKKKIGFISMILACSTLFSACGSDDVDLNSALDIAKNVEVDVEASGNMSTKEFEVGNGVYKLIIGDITGTDITYNVKVEPNKNGIVLEVDDNIIENFEITSDNNVIEISSGDKKYGGIKCNITVGANVNSIETDSICDVEYYAHENSEEITIKLGGTSTVNAYGTVEKAKFDCSSIAELFASELKVTDAEITASDTAVVEVFVDGNINAKLSDMSELYYSGNPENINKDVSDMAEICEKE